jgi:hypothetical protein
MVVLMEEDKYKSQLAKLAFSGFVRDSFQDERPQPVYGFYSKKEAINGTEYEFTAGLKENGEIRMNVSPARPNYDESRIDGMTAISLDTAIANVLEQNIQGLTVDITKKLEKKLPLSNISIHVSPAITVGLKGILVDDSIEPADKIYTTLKEYIENKGR